jgi:hypothetical protein
MIVQVSRRWTCADRVRGLTVAIHAFAVSATKLTYYESVIFSISRVGVMRWDPSSWACPHGEARGEKYSDYREERRAQRGQGHKESCAHRGLQPHAIVESTPEIRCSFCDRHTTLPESNCN